MKWSEGETMTFVKLYREHECLWNATKPSASAAIDKVVQEMNLDGFTVADAKQKIKNLRGT